MNINLKKDILTPILLFFIAFGILVGSGSLYRFVYNYNLIMVFTMSLMCGVIFLQFFIPSTATNKPNFTTNFPDEINYPGLIIIMFFIFSPILSDIINQVESYEITYFYIAMMLIVFLLGTNHRKRILNYYLKIMVVLAVISIFYFFVELFFELPSSVPYYGIARPTWLHFYYVWSKPVTEMIIVRNQSIFWEPGAFGFHLIISMLVAYKTKNKYFIIILLAACLTTLSTTVYVFLVFLFLHQLFYGNNKIKLISITVLSSVAIFLTIWIILGDFELIKYLVEVITLKFSPSSGAYGSFQDRNLYVLESLKLFLDNIFLGAGHYSTDTLLKNTDSETSALAGLMAELGLFGILCILLYIRFFRHFKLFAIPIALIWLNGEYMQYSPIALFILAHSVDDFSNRLFPISIRSPIIPQDKFEHSY